MDKIQKQGNSWPKVLQLSAWNWLGQ